MSAKPRLSMASVYCTGTYGSKYSAVRELVHDVLHWNLIKTDFPPPRMEDDPMIPVEFLMLIAGTVLAAGISIEFLRPLRQTNPF